jgi:uncharacterized protein (TIGR04141 family)
VPEEIFRNPSLLNSRSYSNGAVFYYGESHMNKPRWLKNFFVPSFAENIELFNSSSSGVYLYKINIDSKNHIFALAFGYGWQFLKPGVYDERFGLIAALNIIDPEKLRKIDKKSMISAPKDTSEQLSKAGGIAEFGIDIEQDLLRSISGVPKDKDRFGKIVTGRDALTLSVKVDQLKIKNLIDACYERYRSKDYKKDFDWVDQIAEVKDPQVLEKLNNSLVENIKNNLFEKTWMAVPEIIEWETTEGFKYSGQANQEIFPDISIKDFLSFVQENITFELLKNRQVFGIDSLNQTVKFIWTAYQCLYSELKDDSSGNTFLLTNGKWYQVERDFNKIVETNYSDLLFTSSISLPDYNHKNEGDYNDSLPTIDSNFISLDRKLINYGGKYNKIEFCDLLSKDKKIIHVKYYGGSSVLSHLFSQGLVSGELMISDSNYRKKVLEKITDSNFKLLKEKQKPKPVEFEIIYAIISSSRKPLDIPFFSKVSLKNAKTRLESFGYRVSLTKIKNIK